MVNSEQFHIYLASTSSSATSSVPSNPRPELQFPWERQAEHIRDTNTMIDYTRRWQRQETPQATPGTDKEGESRVSVEEALSWNSREWNLTSTLLIENDLHRVQHAYSYTPHDYTRDTGLLASHSGYSPRQSIPQDVSNPSGSLWSYLENENKDRDEEQVEVARGAERQRRAKWRTDFASERVKAKAISDSTLCAIDPGCVSSIVRFDYSCLDDLDDELILRPRNAFAELCWSTVVRNHPRTCLRACSSRNISYSHLHHEQELSHSGTSIPPPPSYSLYSRDAKQNPDVEVFSVTDDDGETELDTSSETDTSSTSTSWLWHGSVEEAAVMMVTGRQSLGTLERQSGSSAKGFDGNTNAAAVVPAESIQPDMKDVYCYRHDNTATSHLDFSADLEVHRQGKLDVDAGSFISFNDDDNTPIPLSNYTDTHTHPRASYPRLHTYAGVAKPQESVGFFPIPVAENKATRIGLSTKSRNRYVGSLGSNVSKFCHAAFPLSGRILKR